MTQFTAPHSTETLVKLLRHMALGKGETEEGAVLLQAAARLVELAAENKHLLDDLMAVRDHEPTDEKEVPL